MAFATALAISLAEAFGMPSSDSSSPLDWGNLTGCPKAAWLDSELFQVQDASINLCTARLKQALVPPASASFQSADLVNSLPGAVGPQPLWHVRDLSLV